MPRRREHLPISLGVGLDIVLRGGSGGPAVAPPHTTPHSHHGSAPRDRGVQGEGRCEVARGGEGDDDNGLGRRKDHVGHGARSVRFDAARVRSDVEARPPCPLRQGSLAPAAEADGYVRAPRCMQELANQRGPSLWSAMGCSYQPDVQLWAPQGERDRPGVVNIIADVRINHDGGWHCLRLENAPRDTPRPAGGLSGGRR
mmetsp:Transcript_2212/g.7897  ORF Transcript_2212/g.7897 Transcript_2212/m.7897 type:complete len:200 (-) Transcript_2212:369-968(-)